MLVLARVALAEDRPQEALNAYDRILKIYPGRLEVIIGKIGALGDLGRYGQIEPLIAQAEAIEPGNPRLLYFRARLAGERHEWSRVRELLQPRESELDQWPDTQLLYGRALLELGLVAQARARLTPLLLHEPVRPVVRYFLAKAQLADDDPQAAAETLKPIVETPDATAQVLALFEHAAREASDPAPE